MGIPIAYRKLVDSCPLPMCATDGEAHVLVAANPAFRALCGKSGEALLGHPIAEVLPELCRSDSLPELLDRAYRTGSAQVVPNLAHSDGERGSVHWSYAVWAAHGRSGQVLGLLCQVTDMSAAIANHQGRERAEAEMQEVNQALLISSVQQHEIAEAATAVAAALVETEERARNTAVLEERNRMAREIHDTMAQAFTGILLQIGVAQRIAGQRPDEAWNLVEHVRELARSGLAEARRSVWALQPEAQEYRDLATALSRVIERAGANNTAEIELHVTGTPRPLPADVGMNLARIGEEALTNSLRHGQARIVWFEIGFGEDRVSLHIQDDGCGFDPARQDGGGFGLISMRQRAERMGGHVTFSSHPGRGTEVAVFVPLSADYKETGTQ